MSALTTSESTQDAATMSTDKQEQADGSSLQPDCCALAERPGKRKAIGRWRESRLRRLEFEARMNRATPHQLARIKQLEAHNMNSATETPHEQP